MVGWVGGNQVDNHATLWSNLQVCKISSRVEIPKLDPSVAIKAQLLGREGGIEGGTKVPIELQDRS